MSLVLPLKATAKSPVFESTEQPVAFEPGKLKVAIGEVPPCDKLKDIRIIRNEHFALGI